MKRRCHSKASFSIRGGIDRLGRDEDGAVAIIFGLVVLPLIVVMGLAIDGGLRYAALSKLQSAVDSAVLAGMQGFATDSASANADARMYFDTNYPQDFLGGELVHFDSIFDARTRTLTVEAEARVPTRFMRVAGIDDVMVRATATAEPTILDLQLAMVLDVTGSMDWNDSNGDRKLDSLKDASTTLIETLFGDSETLDEVAMSVVPYNMFVNIGNTRTSWLQDYEATAWGSEGWAGCIIARSGTGDRSDEPPASAPFEAALNPMPTAGNGVNSRCPASEVLPLTGNRSTIEDHIDGLDADYGTMTNVGFTWGWRTLAESWQGVWNGDVEAVDDDEIGAVKAIVFMTDGIADWNSDSFSAYGYLDDGRLGTTSEVQAEQEITDRLLESCNAAKTAGIEVYTVMFALASAPAYVENSYRRCATSGAHFFDAQTGDDLDAAFRNIAGRLTSLRLTH